MHYIFYNFFPFELTSLKINEHTRGNQSVYMRGKNGRQRYGAINQANLLYTRSSASITLCKRIPNPAGLPNHSFVSNMPAAK